MILLICRFLVVLVGHNITIVGQVIEVCQTEAIFFIFIVDRYQRRNHIHFFQLIFGLFAICEFESHVGVNIKDIFAHVQF